MKTMKTRVLWILALVAICLSGAAFVSADLIYEPYENDFYQEHAREMTTLNHAYEVNAPGGEITIYQSPVSSVKVGTLKNGTEVHGSFSYKDPDGITWIIVTLFGNNGKESPAEGWVPADYLWQVYDSGLFERQYAKEIRDTEGELTIQPGEGVYFYPYPGGGERAYRIDPQFSEPEEIAYTAVFTEENGYRWGRIGYFMGNRDVWINLDAPDQAPEVLYSDGYPAYDLRTKTDPNVIHADPGQGTANGEPVLIVPKSDNTLLIVGILIGAAVVVSAGILVFLKKKPSAGARQA